MSQHDPAAYGESFADVYDTWYPAPTDTAACTESVAALAERGGRRRPVVVELGVGTGRLALPLARRGLDVRGVDASTAMVERLRAKPGGDEIPVALADLVDVPVPRRSGESEPPAPDVVLAAYNVVFNLPDEDAQRRCLRAAAQRLATDGHLVVEAVVPAPEGADDAVRVRSVEPDHVVLTVVAHEPGAQRLVGHFVELRDAEPVRLRPWVLRYLTPTQLDEMAADAGLELVSRRGGWADEPFDGHTGVHVSIYRRSR